MVDLVSIGGFKEVDLGGVRADADLRTEAREGLVGVDAAEEVEDENPAKLFGGEKVGAVGFGPPVVGRKTALASLLAGEVASAVGFLPKNDVILVCLGDFNGLVSA
jgi:hypothetical protein